MEHDLSVKIIAFLLMFGVPAIAIYMFGELISKVTSPNSFAGWFWDIVIGFMMFMLLFALAATFWP